MTPSPPPWQPQAQFPTNSLKLITPIIYISSHSELLSAPQTFLQDLNIQSSLPETPSLAPSLDIISYWPWILALLWQGVCSLNQQIFIKYLQMVTLTNMRPWASYITSLSLNFLIRKKKVTITTFKSYIENYEAVLLSNSVHITASNSNLVSFSPITSSHHEGILPNRFEAPGYTLCMFFFHCTKSSMWPLFSNCIPSDQCYNI